jgi:flavin-dependent dehydrogenase
VNPDVLVIGAGPAGLSAAICFASWCNSVTVIESGERGALRQAGEHVPPAGLAEVAATGLNRLFADHRHGTSTGVSSLWGDSVAVDKDYFFSVQGNGVNIDRQVFDEALAQAVEDAGADLQFTTRLQHLDGGPQGYQASVIGPQGQERIEAKLIVDASGRKAIAGRQLGCVRQRYDRMLGLLGRIGGCAAGDNVGRVFIESMKDGWWYSVQLPCGDRLFTYMTDAEAMKNHSRGPRGLWQDRLSQSNQMSALAKGLAQPNAIDVFDAASQYLDTSAHTSFLAVGDAAMAFDPISSWGITKALCDGHYGAMAMQREHGGEPGAVARHTSQRRENFNQYLIKRTALYETESRWHDSDFWRSRQHSHEQRAN